MSEYDNIFKSVSGGEKQPVNEYDAIMQGLMPNQSEYAPMPLSQAKKESSFFDAPNAVATGFNRGIASLAGLPVDTFANIRDLGKAIIGTPYTAITGQTPEWLQIGNRAKDVGSGAYLTNKLPDALTKTQNPDYEGGYLQAAGGGLAGIINPNSRSQLLNQGLLGVSSAMAGKVTMDATGNQSLGITAALLPGGLMQAATAGTKYAVRGGEEGRKAMAQRVVDLEAAGVTNPTMGLASGNRFIGGVENILSATPGAVGVMRNARQGILDELQATANKAADMASTNRGSLESGVGIQSGLKSFKTDFKGTQKDLYGKLDGFIKNQDEVGIANTMGALQRLNADIPSMPNLSKQFKNSRMVGIEDALKKDMAATDIAGARTGIPYEAAKKLRTLVGGEIENSNFLSDIPRDKWKAVYGSLSGDIESLAATKGSQALQASNRANDYTRSGIARMERTAPFADLTAPESAYKLLANTLNENVSTFQSVKKSLPEGARGQVAGTVIERLGKATNGNQNAGGEVWSPETFLTNWNKITPKGKSELLSGFPNSAQVAKDIEAVANSTAMMRDGSKLWSNPSGTAANAGARATMGAIGLGGAGAAVGMLNPLIPLLAGGGVLGANRAAAALTNKNNIKAMIRPSLGDTERALRALLASGQLRQNGED